MRIRISLLAGAALLSGSVAFAGQGGGQNMSGCGLGSQIFKENNNTKGVQSTAATSNGTFYSQGFGITSGTSGCAAESAWWASRDREVFVAANYRSLSRELSAGEGEYARTFAEVMGCRGESVPAFLSLAKEKYGALFPERGSTPSGMLRALESELAGHEALSKACIL
ncbi:MAG: DUF3015 family protein [Elusimicrobia bacterium]|nr:DUF3015 family protein [Elusimicrobiota bacterium]